MHVHSTFSALMYMYREIEFVFHIIYPAKCDLAGDIWVSFMVNVGEF